MPQPKDPSLSPLRKGVHRGVKNFPKLVLMKLVLAKAGNGEKKFLQSNTIITIV